MKTLKLFILVLLFMPTISDAQQWHYDMNQAAELQSVVVNHEEQYSFAEGLHFTENGADIIHQNLIVFFSMDANSQRTYLTRVVNFWKSDLNITSSEHNKLKKLVDSWYKMQTSENGDQAVLNAVNDLSNSSTTPALRNLLTESGADQLSTKIPSESFELNEVAVTMAGLWGGIIGGGLVAIAGSIISAFTPGIIAEAISLFIDYAMDVGVFIGKKVAQGVSIAAQWIGNGLKKIFGKKGGGGKKKGGNKKSFMPLPGGQGDCCGLPYPIF